VYGSHKVTLYSDERCLEVILRPTTASLINKKQRSEVDKNLGK
jgi:hypothetical protein